MKASGLFEEALNPYLKRSWEEAIEGFKECKSLLPEDASIEMYLTRAQDFQQSPPGEDWDGVQRYFSK